MVLAKPTYDASTGSHNLTPPFQNAFSTLPPLLPPFSVQRTQFLTPLSSPPLMYSALNSLPLYRLPLLFYSTLKSLPFYCLPL